MSIEPLTPNNQSAHGWTPAQDNPLAHGLKTGRMLSGKEVASMFGYKTRSAFWTWVAREKPPVVRLSARNIRFPATALQEWLQQRQITKGQP